MLRRELGCLKNEGSDARAERAQLGEVQGRTLSAERQRAAAQRSVAATDAAHMTNAADPLASRAPLLHWQRALRSRIGIAHALAALPSRFDTE